MLRFLNAILLGGLLLAGASFFLNGAPTNARSFEILTMEERHAMAEQACSAAWQALPGYGEAEALTAQAREDYDEVYACTGNLPQTGDVLLIARYAGGPRENAVSYRIDALCDATGKSLLEEGGRMPEECARPNEA